MPYKNKEDGIKQKLEYYRRNQRRYMLHRIKRRAKEASVRFNLTIDDIVIPTYCPVFGLKLKHGKGRSHGTSPTVDRINAKRGYVKGNVAIISHFANSLKGFATAAQHRRIAEWMESVS